MYLLIAISLVSLALMWMAVRGRVADVKDPRAAGATLFEIDLEAFRNLIDPAQDRFLRHRLSRRDYRRVQRARILAIAGYLHKVAHNASVMLRLGEAARESREPALAAMGTEMVSSAINLRLRCILALARAYAVVLFPGIEISLAPVADRYDHLAAGWRAMVRSWTPDTQSSM